MGSTVGLALLDRTAARPRASHETNGPLGQGQADGVQAGDGHHARGDGLVAPPNGDQGVRQVPAVRRLHTVGDEFRGKRMRGSGVGMRANHPRNVDLEENRNVEQKPQK